MDISGLVFNQPLHVPCMLSRPRMISRLRLLPTVDRSDSIATPSDEAGDQWSG